jgi:PIN domain nuclease of toxin-antitoxin system
MKLLLDTHVWFWALQAPEKLGKTTRAALADLKNELHVSTISTLELGQLVRVGRIELRGTLEAWMRRGLQALDLHSLDLTHPIALLAYALPGEFHKNPADRLLVATAIHHGLTLVTADERLLAYPHAMVLDARR